MFKIFIVEDDVKIREDLESLLNWYGYATQSCTQFNHVEQETLDSEA